MELEGSEFGLQGLGPAVRSLGSGPTSIEQVWGVGLRVQCSGLNVSACEKAM